MTGEPKPDCTFYHEHQRRIESAEISPPPGVDRVRFVPVPYCSHKHSPQPLDRALQLLTPRQALVCGGLRDRCPLSAADFLDQRE